MLKRIFLLICTGIASLTTSAQETNYNVENIPVALKNRANSVLRDKETIVDMRSPENVMYKVKKVITVFNKNGDEDASEEIYYNKNTSIKSIKGVILDAFGAPTAKFTQSNFIDQSAVSDVSMFDDSRVKHYAPIVLSYPYTIIYEYEIRYKQNLVIPDWYALPSSDMSVERSSYTFICKPEDKIRVKEYNYKGKSEIIKTDKSISQTWLVTNLSAIKQEPFSPDQDQFLTYVKVAPEEFYYYGHKGKYTNWNELGKWVYDDLIKNRQVLTAQVIQEMKELVKDIGSDKEKAKRIYEYVQKKTRYISIQIGIGGFQPFPAMDVHNTSYGDCKALVNYTQSLLNAVNIPSYYCVVTGSRKKKNMDADFASMDQGNHIILCIPLKNDTCWVDCTSDSNPFGYLGQFTDDRTVFACTAEGGKILRTPAFDSKNSLLKRKAELILEKDGSITGKLQTELKGSQYENYDWLIQKPYSEQLKSLKDEYDIDNINFTDLKLTQKKDDDPTTFESFNLTIQKYAPKTNALTYLVLNPFNKTKSIPEVKNRKLPVYINNGYTNIDEIVYNLPEGYKLETKFEDSEIKSIFGSYSATTKLDGNKLTYIRKMTINNGTYPADKYADFTDFMSNVSSNDHTKIIFRSN